MSKHPCQPIDIDEKGCVRFQENKLISMMYNICKDNGFSLNEMIRLNRVDDYKQLLQLMGYSVSGYLDYNFNTDEEEEILLKLLEEAIEDETTN